MSNLHRYLPSNDHGRDFIIGDLHGCLDLLKEKMELFQFDPTIDRIFSVGDLADRGPDSMGCLRLLVQPWFHAVRGNHEDMLLGFLPSIESKIKPTPGAGAILIKSGGEWVERLSDEELKELRQVILPKINDLPYVITVGNGPTRFHVAHAELIGRKVPSEKSGYLSKFSSRTNSSHSSPVLTDLLLTDETLERMAETILWGRQLIKEFDANESVQINTSAGPLLCSRHPVRAGLSLTYVGHTPVSKMILHSSHLFIDRGAYKRDLSSDLLMLQHKQVFDWIN